MPIINLGQSFVNTDRINWVIKKKNKIMLGFDSHNWLTFNLEDQDAQSLLQWLEKNSQKVLTGG